MDIKIATSWDDVTLEMYDKIANINVTDEMDVLKIISILSNVDMKTVENITVAEFNELSSKLSFLKTDVKPKKPTENIIIDGIVYNVTLLPQNMTAGQFLDYRTILTSDDIDKKLARLMCCFMIPEGHKYNDGYDTETLVNVIYENMSMVEVSSYSNFFTVVFQAYVKVTLQYLEKELKRMKKRKMDKEVITAMQEQIRMINLLIKNGGYLHS